MPITLQSTITPAEGQVASQLADEIVILNLTDGTYYGLDGVGVRVWELLQQPRTVEAISAAIVDEYEVEPARCQTDVLALLSEMAKAGIIEVA